MRADFTDRFFRARSLLVLSVLFIVYGTTIPWDFAPPLNLDRVVWLPFWDPARGRIAGIPDIVQNVLLFLPFGFFGWIAWNHTRNLGNVGGVVLVGMAGGMLSLLVEMLQTMSPTRTPSTADLIANTAGATIGAIAGVYWQIRLSPRWRPPLERTIARQPGLLVCLALFGALAFDSLMPFYPTLDAGQFKQTLRVFLGDPWGPKNLPSLLPAVLLYAALAVTCAMEISGGCENLPRERSFTAPAVKGAMLAAMTAVLLEIAQFIFHGHSPSLQDAAAGFVGAGIGGLLAHAWGCTPAGKPGDLVRRAPRATILFGLLFPLSTSLVPFVFVPLDEAFDAVSSNSFLPFASLFKNLTAATFFNVFSAAAAYLPLGYALAAIGHPPWRVMAIAAAWGLVCEISQIPVEGRTFDVTIGLYAAMMGLFSTWLLRKADSTRSPAARGRSRQDRRHDR